jgi:hypothetical protein
MANINGSDISVVVRGDSNVHVRRCVVAPMVRKCRNVSTMTKRTREEDESGMIQKCFSVIGNCVLFVLGLLVFGALLLLGIIAVIVYAMVMFILYVIMCSMIAFVLFGVAYGTACMCSARICHDMEHQFNWYYGHILFSVFLLSAAVAIVRK